MKKCKYQVNDNKPNEKKKTLCFYHVTNGFQSESALYSCLNVKELLAQNRRNI